VSYRGLVLEVEDKSMSMRQGWPALEGQCIVGVHFAEDRPRSVICDVFNSQFISMYILRAFWNSGFMNTFTVHTWRSLELY
jgi:hypothetical protein